MPLTNIYIILICVHMFIENAVELLGLVSDRTRLEILLLLKRRDFYVCELVYVLGKSQSLISHNLRLLRASGVVTFTKEGKWFRYSLKKDKRFRFLSYLLEDITLPDEMEKRIDKLKGKDRVGLCKLIKETMEEHNVQGD